MRVPRRLRWFTSVRTTVVLLAVLAAFLLLNVALPQAAVLGEEAFAELVAQSSWNRFVLATLGLGHLSTSPLFLVVLGLFFLNLVLVLAERMAPTWHKLGRRRRSEAGLAAWARTGEALTAPLPERWRLERIVEILRGFGYRPARVGERVFQGVKHRTAPLGFLLFHLSFFFLCGGGLLIWGTRFVGTAVLTEGQEFTGDYKHVQRRPPWGGPPDLAFKVVEVDPRFEDGEPVHLGARFLFRQAGTAVERSARVNVPAEWGTASVLVRQAGVAPVLWLQDAQGYSRDRVAVAAITRGDELTLVPLDGERYLVIIRPPASAAPFPTRETLATTPIHLRVMLSDDPDDPQQVFAGELRLGEAAELGDARLVLEDVRFWVGVQVVSERGGGLLVTGFVLGIVGLVWRLLLYRREVALVWDDETVRLVGRSEYFPERFRDELTALFDTLVGENARGEGSSHLSG